MANNEKRETSFSERIFNSHQKAKSKKNLQQLPKTKKFSTILHDWDWQQQHQRHQ